VCDRRRLLLLPAAGVVVSMPQGPAPHVSGMHSSVKAESLAMLSQEMPFRASGAQFLSYCMPHVSAISITSPPAAVHWVGVMKHSPLSPLGTKPPPAAVQILSVTLGISHDTNVGWLPSKSASFSQGVVARSQVEMLSVQHASAIRRRYQLMVLSQCLSSGVLPQA
jgi:hypothetical protein